MGGNMVQWNPINTVTNGSYKFGCVNGVAVLPGQAQGRNDKCTIHRRAVL